VNYTYKARVTEVYDGDTVTVDIDLGFHMTMRRVKLRLAGLDAPEVRGPERQLGLAARDALRAKALGHDVVIQTFKDATEKYGRYLAVVTLDGENVNEWLVALGYATRYMAEGLELAA